VKWENGEKEKELEERRKGSLAGKTRESPFRETKGGEREMPTLL